MAMGGIEEFNWQANVTRVGAGFKNTPYFNNPTPVPTMDIGGDWPAEVLEKMKMMTPPEPTPTDPWVARYPNSKM